MKFFITLLITFISATLIWANTSHLSAPFVLKDSTEQNKRSLLAVTWVPVSLSLISLDLMRDSTKYRLQTLLRSGVKEDFRTHVDDWIHYAPILTMYTADLLKVPAKNTVWNQTKFLVMSELITSGIVHALKNTLKIRRPNFGAYTAYPSGHTSQAFVQSQVLYNEFRETAPLLAASGYLFSFSTGALRILNNKHWLPDVFLGAGIGILVTNLVYYFEPFKDWNPFQKSKLDVSFVPQLNPDYKGATLSLRF
jgi:membrane-associated phospholipid phosphatase